VPGAVVLTDHPLTRQRPRPVVRIIIERGLGAHSPSRNNPLTPDRSTPPPSPSGPHDPGRTGAASTEPGIELPGDCSVAVLGPTQVAGLQRSRGWNSPVTGWSAASGCEDALASTEPGMELPGDQSTGEWGGHLLDAALQRSRGWNSPVTIRAWS
jgi:hypothetical protein